ncbi:MAG: hybrid sensor histidine kinase/response regulator, partial [Kordiimonas sp.]
GIDETLLSTSANLEEIIVTKSDTAEGYLIGYAPLTFTRNGVDTTWYLVVVRDYRLLANSIITIAAYPSELLATFLLIVSILAIAFLRQHLERRITPLLQASARLARNEKGVRANLAGQDEFAEIAASFDQMAARIDRNRVDLEQAIELAGQANAAKNHFLSHMSHEIQTPLTTILGFLELLKDTKLDSDASLYLRTMETSARTLSYLVNDLLEINRLEAGTITPQPHPFCLNTVVQEIIDSQLPRVRDKGLSIKVTTSESDPIWLDSDARIFRQILVNLVGNAIQYTEEGGINIVIEPLPHSSSEINLQISVVDTGIGISERDLPLVFERFYRSDEPLVRTQKGAGLGLTICKDFADLLNGNISIESQKGVGTSVIFTVKVHKAQPDMEFDFADLSLREQESQNILLVEHEPVTQVLFRSILEKSGHHVDVCNNAQTAIQFVKDRLIYPHLPSISLIIMDLHLPQKDGFQASREIRGLDTKFKNIPIMATSTQDDSTTRNRCLDGAFDGFIAKPINQQYLIEEIFRLTKLADNNRPTEPALKSQL